MLFNKSFSFIIIDKTINKTPLNIMVRAPVSAATVTNRVRKKADFSHRVRVLGGGPHTPTQLFWGRGDCPTR